MSQTLLIIVITAAISIYALSERNIMGKLIMDPVLVKHGQYYRLLTSGFIHLDYTHLAFNMLTLYFFGRYMEDVFNYFGKFIFIIFYLLAIIVSSLPPFFKNINNQYYAALGASGGVSAVLFSFIVLQPWATIYIFILPCPAVIYGILFLAYSWYMGKRNADNIGHDAHFFGAIFGVVALLILDHDAIARFLQALAQPHFHI